MKDTALNGRPISQTMMCYTVSAVATPVEYEHSPKILYRNNQRNSMLGHMETDLEMKQFRQIILNELSGADMRRRHGAVAFLIERFPAALPRGKFLFSDEGVINLISSSQNFVFWPNGTLITPFIWKTTHHVVIWRSVIAIHVTILYIFEGNAKGISYFETWEDYVIPDLTSGGIMKQARLQQNCDPLNFNQTMLLNSLRKLSQDWTCCFINPSTNVTTFTQS